MTKMPKYKKLKEFLSYMLGIKKPKWQKLKTIKSLQDRLRPQKAKSVKEYRDIDAWILRNPKPLGSVHFLHYIPSRMNFLKWSKMFYALPGNINRFYTPKDNSSKCFIPLYVLYRLFSIKLLKVSYPRVHNSICFVPWSDNPETNSSISVYPVTYRLTNIY